MIFKFVKQVDGSVKGYDGKELKTGDTVEYDKFFSAKAKKNPSFEEVKKKPRAGASKAKASNSGEEKTEAPIDGFESLETIGDFSDVDLGVTDGDTKTNN